MSEQIETAKLCADLRAIGESGEHTAADEIERLAGLVDALRSSADALRELEEWLRDSPPGKPKLATVSSSGLKKSRTLFVDLDRASGEGDTLSAAIRAALLKAKVQP